MSDYLNEILNSICHRGGPHEGLLPLCLRCSCVYAGAFTGIIFEVLLQLWRKRKPGKVDFYLAASALALMGVVGVSGLYGFSIIPDILKIFSAFCFGWAVAFFAISAIGAELDSTAFEPQRLPLKRIALLVLFAVWTLALRCGGEWSLKMLSGFALPGLFSAFLTVNFAFAFVLLRRLPRASLRFGGSFVVLALMAAVEFALFHFWRRML